MTKKMLNGYKLSGNNVKIVSGTVWDSAKSNITFLSLVQLNRKMTHLLLELLGNYSAKFCEKGMRLSSPLT